MLANAVQKIPSGTLERYEKIAQMVSTVRKRTAKEIVKKLKQQEIARQLGKTDVSQLKTTAAFDQFKRRIEKETEIAAKTQVKLVDNKIRSISSIDSTNSDEKAVQNVVVKETAAAVAVAVAPTQQVSSSGSDEWSAAQQAAFETALKEVAKDAPDRWDQIAARIEGKTKAQAVARFKFIRDEIMRKKMAQQSRT